MKTTFKILPVILLLQLISSCALRAGGDTAVACPRVESIKTMPFRGDRGVDPAYDRLRFDGACEGVLVASLSDTQKMADPRQMPPDERFVVSDAALFILLERHGISVESVLPAEVAMRLKSRGILAYFDYVASPAGRDQVISRAKLQVGK